MQYSSRHVCLLYGVAPETVRNWSEEFARYLSVTANPGRGRHRNFTDEDMQVFALIAELKRQGMTYDDIQASLNNGQRGEAPALPPNEMQALVSTDEKRQSSLQMQQLENQIARLLKERDDALMQLQPTRDQNIKLQAKVEFLQEQLDELKEEMKLTQRRIEELNREVGRYAPPKD